MKNLIIILILFIIPGLIDIGCRKDALDQKINSSGSADKAIIIPPMYFFSPWQPLDGRHINFWFADATAANSAATVLTYYMATPQEKEGNIAIKKVILPTPIGDYKMIDMEDPCDPVGPPYDEDFTVKKRRNGTIITKMPGRTVIQKANGKIMVLDCGGSNDSYTTFTITFTLYTVNPFAPDYTGYITVTEDENHNIIGNPTFKVEVNGYGYGYGDFETTIPGTVKTSANESGHVLAFDFHGQLNTAMGLGRLQMHAGFKTEVWGFVQLDHLNNPGYMKVQMKQY